MARLRTLSVLLSAGLAFTVLQGGSAQAVNIGQEGCTPGYWKQSQHFDSYEEYQPTTTLDAMFTDRGGVRAFAGANAATLSYAGLTVVQGLSLKGGKGVSGAAQILLRAATASFLNAANEGVGYPYRRFNVPFNIFAQLEAALASGNRAQMLALARTLDAANNLGCPLN